MMSLKFSTRHMCIVDGMTDKLIQVYLCFVLLSRLYRGAWETCGVCKLGLDGRKESRDDGVFTACLHTREIPGTGVRDSDRPVYCYLPTYLPYCYHTQETRYVVVLQL
jgi:hypothetical protein